MPEFAPTIPESDAMTGTLVKVWVLPQVFAVEVPKAREMVLVERVRG